MTVARNVSEISNEKSTDHILPTSTRLTKSIDEVNPPSDQEEDSTIALAIWDRREGFWNQRITMDFVVRLESSKQLLLPFKDGSSHSLVAFLTSC